MFDPRANFFSPFWLFCRLVFSDPCPASPPGLSTGHTHKSRTTPSLSVFPDPHAQAPPAQPLFESSYQRLLPKISHHVFRGGRCSRSAGSINVSIGCFPSNGAGDLCRHPWRPCPPFEYDSYTLWPLLPPLGPTVTHLGHFDLI